MFLAQSLSGVWSVLLTSTKHLIGCWGAKENHLCNQNRSTRIGFNESMEGLTKVWMGHDQHRVTIPCTVWDLLPFSFWSAQIWSCSRSIGSPQRSLLGGTKLAIHYIGLHMAYRSVWTSSFWMQFLVWWKLLPNTSAAHLERPCRGQE